MSNYYLHEKDDSPAKSLLKLTWNHACEAYFHSWNRFNGAMHDAMELAVRRGFIFNEDDIEWVSQNLRPSYWYNIEYFYLQACDVGNPSAWKSIEKYLGRKPFIIDGSRLRIRSRFNWQGEWVTVTSFADDQSYVVACSYHQIEKEFRGGGKYYEDSNTVKHIYKITHADIYQRNKEIKEFEKSTQETAKEQQP